MKMEGVYFKLEFNGVGVDGVVAPSLESTVDEDGKTKDAEVYFENWYRDGFRFNFDETDSEQLKLRDHFIWNIQSVVESLPDL